MSLLLQGDVQRVAEDLESRLFMTESTCLGRLTADIEHLPVKSREYRIHNAEWIKAERWGGGGVKKLTTNPLK